MTVNNNELKNKKVEREIVCPNCGTIIKDLTLPYCPVCDSPLKTEKELAEEQFSWNIALSLVFMTFLVYFGAYYALNYVLTILGNGVLLLNPTTYVLFLALQGIFLVIPLIYFKAKKLDFAKLIFETPSRNKIFKDVVVGILAAFLFFLILELVYQVTVSIFGLSEELIELIELTTPRTEYELFLHVMVSVFILAPSTEILIRGIFQRFLSKAHGKVIGIVGSSLFYSLLFLSSVVSFATLFTLQLLLAILFEKRDKSLYATIPSHMMFWIISILIPYLIPYL